ncbi:MAG: dephospho-CoA kinase [Paludibacteraceae bacterium]
MTVVGITGGIGSGKSVVSRVLRMLDFPVYDSDARAKALYDEDPALRDRLIELFGAQIYRDGQLCRRDLAAVVFGRPARLQQLNALVHPAVFRDFERWRRAQTASVVFAESAILLQTDFYKYMDRVLLVDAPIEVRLQRVAQRDGVTSVAIANRMAEQMSSVDMRSKADWVIENDDSQSVIKQILMFLQTLHL